MLIPELLGYYRDIRDTGTGVHSIQLTGFGTNVRYALPCDSRTMNANIDDETEVMSVSLSKTACISDYTLKLLCLTLLPSTEKLLKKESQSYPFHAFICSTSFKKCYILSTAGVNSTDFIVQMPEFESHYHLLLTVGFLFFRFFTCKIETIIVPVFQDH